MEFAWPEFGIGFIAGAGAATLLIFAQRRTIVRYFTNRELDRTRSLISEGRLDEASDRLRRMVRDGLLADEVPGMALRQLREVYRGSIVGQSVSRIQVMIESYQSERANLTPGDVRGRISAILKALDTLPSKEPLE